MNSNLETLLGGTGESQFTIQTSGPGPSGTLPITEEMLRNDPSGDLFGLTQNAGKAEHVATFLGNGQDSHTKTLYEKLKDGQLGTQKKSAGYLGAWPHKLVSPKLWWTLGSKPLRRHTVARSKFGRQGSQ